MKAKKKVAKKKSVASRMKVANRVRKAVKSVLASKIPKNTKIEPDVGNVVDFEFPKADITEADLRDLLKKEAETVTMETLPAFMDLALKRSHDYGTICVAIGMCAVAAAKAADRSPEGGITGFQAGAVFWEFLRGWGTFGEGPKRIVNYTNLLYPQYKDDFTTISSDTWEWVKEEAAKNIAEVGITGTFGVSNPAPQVLAHWKKIVESSRPPFGLSVKD